jgi:hypothetical protein
MHGYAFVYAFVLWWYSNELEALGTPGLKVQEVPEKKACRAAMRCHAHVSLQSIKQLVGGLCMFVYVCVFME